ncbi:glycan metabolism protein RagB [Clostridia bacterium]|nr:glycan metabolism protein RagB [Clostridia bacterium]
MRTKYFIISIIAAASMTFSSCTLDFEPQNVIKGEAVSADNFDAMIAPMYNLYWFNFNDKFYFGLGDGMAFNLLAPGSSYIKPFADLSVTSTSEGLQEAWNSFYIVIQQSNKVMIDIKNNTTVTDEEKTPYLAEARFMRGLAYWHLVSLWGNVIISEDPGVLVENPIVNVNTAQDAYEFAIRDMEYAAKYLPETSTNGRLNRTSAFGMLSRFYLVYSGFAASNYGQNPNCGTHDAAYLALAKKAAEKVLANPAYKLMDNYPDLFMVDNNNNSESLFAFQWVPGSSSQVGWGVTNSQQRFLACDAALTGSDAWGDYTFCPYNMISEYQPEDTIRRKATWMGYGDHYPEISIANGGYTYTAHANGEASTQLNVKKGVTGSNKDNPKIGTNNSALDNYMLRLAEVYLNYAEAILGDNTSTTDAAALYYFNAVRQRAGLQPKNAISWEDLRYERRIEFCMEGRYWYDLVARAYYKQNEVVKYLNDQDRGTRPSILFTAPNNLRINEENEADHAAVGTATAGTFRLPYPEGDAIKNPKMNEPPVPYTFTEERITDLFN